MFEATSLFQKDAQEMEDLKTHDHNSYKVPVPVHSQAGLGSGFKPAKSWSWIRILIVLVRIRFTLYHNRFLELAGSNLLCLFSFRESKGISGR